MGGNGTEEFVVPRSNVFTCNRTNNQLEAYSSFTVSDFDMNEMEGGLELFVKPTVLDSVEEYVAQTDCEGTLFQLLTIILFIVQWTAS